jgi:hypothetical protein
VKVATQDDVRRVALLLPETTESDNESPSTWLGSIVEELAELITGSWRLRAPNLVEARDGQ